MFRGTHLLALVVFIGALASFSSASTPPITSNVPANPLPLRDICILPPIANLCHEYSVTPAIQDPTVSNTSGGHVLYLFGGQLTFGFTEFIWDQNGGFFDVLGTSAFLWGNLVPLNGPTTGGFHLWLSLDLVFDAAGHIDISPPSLVDPSTWSYFTVNTGSRLVGFGTWAGTNLLILQQTAAFPFQVGFGADGKNLGFGAAMWLNLVKWDCFNYTVVAGDINVNLNCSQTLCPSGNELTAVAAQDDSFATDTGGFAFTFFLPPSGIDIQNWVFSSTPALGGQVFFVGNTLRLTGTLVPFAGTHAPLEVDCLFVRTTPPSSPHIELSPSAYVGSGGPIDPSDWWFYSFSSECVVAGPGILLTLTQQDNAPPLQVGVGASGKNIRFGASAWFDWATETGLTGSGDINLNLNCPNGSSPSTTTGSSSSTSSSTASASSTSSSASTTASSSSTSSSASTTASSSSSATTASSASTTASSSTGSSSSTTSGSWSCLSSVTIAARGASWTQGGSSYQTYDITLTNTGFNCNIFGQQISFNLAPGSSIDSPWNLDLFGSPPVPGVYEVTNFGETLLPGASFANAGFILQGGGAVSVNNVDTECTCPLQ